MSDPTQTTPQTPQTPQTTVRHGTPIVNHKEFDPLRLVSVGTERKTFQTPNGTPGSYNIVNLAYNYGNSEKPMLCDFYLELCPLKSATGIFEKKPTNQDGTVKLDGKSEYSIMSPLNIQGDLEHVACYETLQKLHRRCCEILEEKRTAVGLPRFTADRADNFTECWTFRKDKTTGAITGTTPDMYLKIFKRGEGPYAEQTQFFGANNEKIGWTMMKGVQIEYIPLMHVKRIYIGSKQSVQMDLAQAIVTDIRARGSENMQGKTLATIESSIADRVAAQLNDLTARDLAVPLVEQRATSSTQSTQSTQHAGAPTFTGLPSNAQDNSQHAVQFQQVQNPIPQPSSSSSTQLSVQPNVQFAPQSSVQPQYQAPTQVQYQQAMSSGLPPLPVVPGQYQLPQMPQAGQPQMLSLNNLLNNVNIPVHQPPSPMTLN